MAFVPALNTVMAEVRQTIDGQQIENTLYFQSDDPPTVASMTTLGTGIAVWWEDFVLVRQSNQIEFREVYLTDLTTATAPTVTIGPFTGKVGGVGVDSCPNNAAFCVSFRTAGRGRSARGRNYVAGLPESEVVRSRLVGAFRTQLVAAYEEILPPDALAPGYTWVVVSRFTAGAPRVTALVQPITAVSSVDDVVDSQRRRLPGRGT